MNRPKLPPEKHRKRLVISLSPKMIHQAKASGNASKYLENAAVTCAVLVRIIKQGHRANLLDRLEAALGVLDPLGRKVGPP